jgi:hypothetical protein
MLRYIGIGSDTAKFFANRFVFKKGVVREGLPKENPSGLGAGGLEFKSPRPDQLLLAQ